MTTITSFDAASSTLNLASAAMSSSTVTTLDISSRPILVVGADRLATEALAAALDPTNTRCYPCSASEAVGHLDNGGVQIVVLLPRGVDSASLLSSLRRYRGTHLIVASSGFGAPPPEFSGVRPYLATTLEEVMKQVHQFNALTAEIALTSRHIDILQRLALGDTPTEAAVVLGITVKTLNNHLGVIYRRLNTRNVTQAVLVALRSGLVQL